MWAPNMDPNPFHPSSFAAMNTGNEPLGNSNLMKCLFFPKLTYHLNQSMPISVPSCFQRKSRGANRFWVKSLLKAKFVQPWEWHPAIGAMFKTKEEPRPGPQKARHQDLGGPQTGVVEGIRFNGQPKGVPSWIIKLPHKNERSPHIQG